MNDGSGNVFIIDCQKGVIINNLMYLGLLTCFADKKNAYIVVSFLALPNC